MKPNLGWWVIAISVAIYPWWGSIASRAGGDLAGQAKQAQASLPGYRSVLVGYAVGHEIHLMGFREPEGRWQDFYSCYEADQEQATTLVARARSWVLYGLETSPVPARSGGMKVDVEGGNTDFRLPLCEPKQLPRLERLAVSSRMPVRLAAVRRLILQDQAAVNRVRAVLAARGWRCAGITLTQNYAVDLDGDETEDQLTAATAYFPHAYGTATRALVVATRRPKGVPPVTYMLTSDIERRLAMTYGSKRLRSPEAIEAVIFAVLDLNCDRLPEVALRVQSFDYIGIVLVGMERQVYRTLTSAEWGGEF